MQLKSLKNQKSEETKEKLLEATKDILAQYGIQYCTIRNICEVSGVSSGSFYHHFGSKENIISVYIDELYKKAIEINKPPEKLYEDGFAVDVMWPFLVYGKFCEALGIETVKAICFNEEQDTFQKNTLNTTEMRGIITEYILSQDSRYDNSSIVEDIFLDIQTIYRGALANWVWYGASGKRTLCENMEHLMFRFLLSFTKDQAVSEQLHSGILICEEPGFDSYFDMSFVKIANDK